MDANITQLLVIDAACLLQHMIDLFDEICLHALGPKQTPRGGAGMHPGALPPRACRHHVTCAIMLGGVLTKILPNLASLFHAHGPSTPAGHAGQAEVASVLVCLAQTTGGGGEGGDGGQSGAMAHVHLLLTCGELQALELAAGSGGW